MICTNCRAEVPDSVKVCGYCGHRLKDEEPEAVRHTEPSGPQSPSEGLQLANPKGIWPFFIAFLMSLLLSIPALLGGLVYGGAGQAAYLLLPLLLAVIAFYGYWRAKRRATAVVMLVMIAGLHLAEGPFSALGFARLFYPYDISLYLILLIWMIFDAVRTSPPTRNQELAR